MGRRKWAYYAPTKTCWLVSAHGDRRGFVVVDRFANVHSLSRYIKDHKAKYIKAKLAPLKVIDFVDEDSACDDEIWKLAYELFARTPD